MSTFDTALNDVFDGRETNFTEHLRDLLRQLYERGGHDLRHPPPRRAPMPSTLPVGSPHIGLGKAIPTIAHLRRGDTFQNEFLRGQGQHRVVVERHFTVTEDGARNVTHLTTNLVGKKGLINQNEDFKQHKLREFRTYRRIS